MFKLTVLSAILAVASAVPTFLHGGAHLTTIAAAPVLATGVQTVLQPETIHVHESTLAKVGDLVQKVPTAVSHQRQTIVHNHADVITPIIAPAVKTYTSHILKAYSTPIVYAASAPVIKVLHHD